MIYDLLIEPFQYAFMVKALIACVLIGVVCPLFGAHVINREMGFMSDALAHAVLPGMVAAYTVGINPFFGAVPMGIIVALLIGYIVRKSNISNDTSIGILFSGLFALGITAISMLEPQNSSLNIESILLGQIASVSMNDLYVYATLTISTLVIMAFFHRHLVFIGFDFDGAKVAGLHSGKLDYLLLVLLSIVIVVTLQIVGVILVVGLLITPAASASLLVNHFSKVIVLGILFGVIASISGLYISYHFNLPSGPAIALISTSIFGLSFLKKLQVN
ncbi:MAG TPA: hypothetical protein DCG42_11855 [Maribacter sp.]|nr:hypothetical protein [Maribacter sp.]